MICPEQQRLLIEYSRYTMEHSDAVRALGRSTDFELERLRAHEAREKCASAKHALDAHLAEHGCGISGSVMSRTQSV